MTCFFVLLFCLVHTDPAFPQPIADVNWKLAEEPFLTDQLSFHLLCLVGKFFYLTKPSYKIIIGLYRLRYNFCFWSEIMYCSKCGTQLSDGENYCKNCGIKVGDNEVKEPDGLTVITYIAFKLAGYVLVGALLYGFLSDTFFGGDVHLLLLLPVGLVSLFVVDIIFEAVAFLVNKIF